MPVYSYKALDRQGRQAVGTLPADSRVGAFDQLAARGLSPISVDEQGAAGAANGGASRLGRLFGSGAPAPVDSKAPGLNYASTTPASATKVKQSAIESFTREMSNLLAAGLPLSRAL